MRTEGLDDHTITRNRESVILRAPDAALRLSRQIEDQRWRELYQSDLVRRLAKERPELAKELLDEMQQPEARYRALIAYATGAPISFRVAQALLIEAAKTGLPGHFSEERAYDFAYVLLRFAPDQPDQVAQLLAEQLKPHEAIVASAHIAWNAAHRLDAPKAARRIIEQARELIPRTDDPAQWTIRLISSGYAQLEPTEAGEMFDAFVLPAIVQRKQETAYPLSVLALVDLELLISRAQVVAESLGMPLIDVLPYALGRAAVGFASDLVLQWLKTQPSCPVKSASIAAVASYLQFEPGIGSAGDLDKMKGRYELLSKLVSSIEDPTIKWKAMDSLLSLAKALQLPHQDILHEWRELWATLPEVRSEVVQQWDFGRLPLDEQKRRITEKFDPGSNDHWTHEDLSPWRTAEMIHQSSLPAPKKQSLYRQMAQETDVPMARAAIARYLAWEDYAEALRLMWQTLPTPRSPRMPYTDTSPSFDQPLNAQAALVWIQEGRKAYARTGEADKVVAILWSHAATVPASDRSAVMEELARTLLDDGQHAKALGVAQQISDLPRRLVLMSEIANAAAKSGEKLN